VKISVASSRVICFMVYLPDWLVKV